MDAVPKESAQGSPPLQVFWVIGGFGVLFCPRASMMKVLRVLLVLLVLLLCVLVLLLRGTILNRTYVTHQKLYIYLFLRTMFGPISCGPP